MQWAGLIAPEAAVLDVAAGGGRHSRFFADRGHRVTAVDRDTSRVAAHAGVETVEADLEDGSPWPLPGRTFGAVVVTNYLHRPLFPDLVGALRPGGVLIYETFALGNERYGRPSNPAFILRPDELLHSVEPLAVVAFEQGLVSAPKQAVIQRVCAVREGRGSVPLEAPGRLR